MKFSLTVRDDKGATSNNPASVGVTVKVVAPIPSPSPSITTVPSNQPKVNVSNGYVFVRQWGSQGTSIAIDTNITRNVYIVDNVNNLIQKFYNKMGIPKVLVMGNSMLHLVLLLTP